MPWKLIVFLLTLTLIVCFIGFNLDHQSDISFGFYSFEEVPIFVSLFSAFLLGCLIMLPFTFRRGKRPGRSAGEDRGRKKEVPGGADNRGDTRQGENGV